MKFVLIKKFLQSVDNLTRRYLAIILFFSYRFIRIQWLIFLAFNLIKQKSDYTKPIKGLAFGRQIFDEDTNAISKYSLNVSIDSIHKSYFFMYLNYLSLYTHYDLPSYFEKGENRESVKKHLISDRKVGFFFSGGTDSLSILSKAKNYINNPKLFTYNLIGFILTR